MELPGQLVNGADMQSGGNGQARRSAGRVWSVLSAAAFLALAGCRTADPLTPAPPGGGAVYVMDADVFAATVAPVFTARGCDSVECHGGGIRGTFALSPAGAKNLALDFAQASLQVNGDDPAASPLLLKPLPVSAGGVPHGGELDPGAFTSTDDADYQAILAWIEAGEYR